MRRFRNGFSLVEVVIALGVIAFALLTMLALLPIAMTTNHTSSQETRGSFILTTLESDLRNTHPSANNGKSQYFGLALPYTTNSVGRVILNTANISVNTVSTAYSVGLNGNEVPNSMAATPPAPYQATVIYTRLPTTGAPSPIEARLIVSWPCRNTTSAIALTSLTNGAGFVESYISFPAP